MNKINGFGSSAFTFKANEDLSGKPVVVSANGEVSACSQGDKFCGVCIIRRGNEATVQTSGLVRLGYTGAAPSFGYIALSADGEGGVKTDESGRPVTVVEVDEAAKTVGFIF